MLFVFPIKVLLYLALFCSSLHSTTSQQDYPYCSSSAEYVCNGLHKTCHTYLTFRARFSYKNARSIAALLGSDPTQIAQINDIQISDDFVTEQPVIVPINCSCSGNYYRSNTAYLADGYYTVDSIARDIFQALTTCQAIQDQSGHAHVLPGQKLVIPLRCACPTKNQTDVGIKYLITYPVQIGDSAFSITKKFDADFYETMKGNNYSNAEDFHVELSTTILVPLRNLPNVPSKAPPRRPSSVILCTD